MANSDKNIRIQPNRNSTLFPKITFTGQSNNPITLNVLDDNSISFEGSAGQLFSINNNLSSGYIFSVNDISGLPSFRINADGTVGIAEFYGNVGIGITNPSYKFHSRGDSYFSSTGNTALLLLSGTGGTIIASNSVNITLTDPARKGLVINAATSQSANLLEWYADGGVGLGYALAGTIRPTGQVHLGSPGLTMSNGGSAILGLQGRGSSEGLAIRGYNSNFTNPLFEIQGNAGAQLFGIYGDGGVNAPRINVTNGTASTSTTTGALVITGGVGIGGTLNVNNIGIGYTGIPYNPSIAFIGTTGDPIRLNVLSNNTLSFEGRSGQLFSINNNLSSGWIFSVNDISGIPLFRANADATISMAEYAGNVGIGLSNPTFKFQVNGSASIGATLNVNRLRVTSKITFEPGTGTSAVSGWTGIGLTSLSRMIYGGGRFIGVGGSYVAYSTDGVNFTYTTIPGSTSAAQYVDVAYGNGVYVAGNLQDVAFIAYSYDGAAWGTTSLPRGLIRTVCFGNGKFLAFNEAPDVVYSSTDGRNWSTIGNLGQYGREAFFANGYFLSTRGYNLYYSVDGASWKQSNIPYNQFIYSVAYGKGLYIAPEYNSTILHTSTDLFTWTQRSIPNLVWVGASYVNGVFYLIPNNDNRLYHSLDGINWSNTNFGTLIGGTNKMFTANDRLYLFSSYGPTLWSTDATTGTLMAKPFYNGEIENTRIGAVNPDSATFTHLAALNPVNFTSATASTGTDSGALIVKGGVGIGGTTNLNTLRINQDLVFTPTTGTIATAGGLLTANFPSFASAGSSMTRTVTFGNGRFVGSAGTSIIWSEDAVNWNRVNTPFTSVTMISQIAYGNGTWVATKYDAGTEIIYSTNNGNSWSLTTVPFTVSPFVVYGNGIFVTGSGQYTGISTNGINWSTYSPVTQADRFINGYFYSTTHRSPDGINWQTLNTPASNAHISYGNGMYFAGEYNSTNYYISYDGVNFSTTTISNNVHLNSAYYNGVYYLTTQHNLPVLKYSTDGFNYTNVSYPNGSTNYGIAYGNNKIVLFNNLYTEATNYIYYAEASFGKANIQPFREGTIDNVTIGSRIPQAGTFNNVSVLKNLNVNSNFQSVSSNTGALTILGGVGIGGSINIGGRVGIGTNLLSSTFNLLTPTSSTIGAFIQGISSQTADFIDTANSSGIINFSVGANGNVLINLTSASSKGLIIKANASQSVNLLELQNSSASPLTTFDQLGNLNISSTTASGSTTTGALVVAGGVGIGGTINANTVNVVRDFNHTPNITTIGGASGWVASTVPQTFAPNTFRYLNDKYIGIGGTYIYYSDDMINWSSVMVPNLDTTRNIADITYGEGKYVFVQYYTGNAGYSTNLTNWTNVALQYNTWTKVVYGNGRFVADSGGSPYAYSLDGTSWVMVNDAKLGFSQTLQFINGYFYSCNSASISRSVDGVNWQACNTPAVPYGLAYGNGLYVGGVYNSGTVVYSYDGLNFSSYSGTSYVHNNSWFYNGVYYLTTNNNNAIRYSTDGFNWSIVGGFPAAVNNLQYIKGKLYAGSGNTVWVTDATPGRFEVNPLRTGTLDDVEIGRLSPNNANFIDVSVNNNLNVSSQYDSASYLDGALTVAGGVGIGKTLNVGGSVNVSNSLNLVNSTTGIATTWTRTVVGTAATIGYLAYANNLYVGVGYSSLTSTDGVNWTTRTLPHNLSSVAFGNGIWSGLLGNSALGATSTNGTTWTSFAMTNSRNWTVIAFGNGKFVTLGLNSSVAAYSTNGYNWTEVTMPVSGIWVWLTYGGGYFVGVANGSTTAIYSTDGINWNTTTLPSAAGWNRISYGNGYYFVVGSGNASAYSKDLINWTFYPLTVNGGNTLYSEYNNGTFVVVDASIGTNSNIITGDFSSRTAVAIPFTQSLAALVAGDRNFIAGYGQTFYTFPIPNNSITLSPNTTGEINNVEIGNIKPASGNFSNIFSQGLVAIGATTRSTTPFNGSLTVSGGVGIGGTLNANSVVTYNRLQNQSFSGASVGASDGLMGNFSTNYQYQSYGNGIYVVSSPGANNARYSTDGLSWQNTTLPVNQAYPINFYGNGYFVLSASGSTTVLYSTNGSSWSQVSIGNTFARTSGVYGNGKYIIVGSGSTYNYSSNLTTWSSSTLPFDSTWYITYGNGMFVALGNGTRNLLYSYDGLNWNLGNINTTSGPWSGIKYGNGVFVASSLANPSNNTSGTIYSYDGINWYQGSISNQDFYNVSYGNGVYFGNNANAFWTSTDGANWSSATSFSFSGHSVESAYGYNKFNTIGRFVEGPANTVTLDPKFTGEINNVRIGAVTPASGDFTNLSSTGSANLVGTVNANNLNILSKINQTPVLGGFAGTTGWTSAALLSGSSNNALTFGNGLFISILRASSTINFSSDGKRWTASTMPFVGQWNDVAWGKDKFVAVAGVGTTGAFSGNGISWSSMNMPATAEGWYAVTYGDDKFVAVGNTSTAAYSSDGITWSGSSIANTNWTGIAYGNGTFVAVAGVGQSGAYSYDGISWNYVNLPTATGGATTKFITYGNGYFVVTNYVSTSINYSRDGINWSTSTRTSTASIHTDLAYGNGIYSIFNYSEASYSYDAINWLNGNSIASTDWQAVAYGNNRFVATSINTGQVGSIDGPSNTLNLYPKFTGDIDNVRIGAKQPAAAEFTNLAAQQPVRFTANTPSTNTTNGALVVLGGVGIGASVNIGGRVGIGTNLLNAALNIQVPSTTTSGIILRGNTSQSADTIKTFSAAGDTNFAVSSGGRIVTSSGMDVLQSGTVTNLFDVSVGRIHFNFPTWQYSHIFWATAGAYINQGSSQLQFSHSGTTTKSGVVVAANDWNTNNRAFGIVDPSGAERTYFGNVGNLSIDFGNRHTLDLATWNATNQIQTNISGTAGTYVGYIFRGRVESVDRFTVGPYGNTTVSLGGTTVSAGLIVKAAASQTGNLIETQSSTGATNFYVSSTGAVSIGSSVDSTSTTNGALKVSGGVGISGNVNVGGSVNFSSSIFGGVSTSIVPTMTFIGPANDPITLSVLSDNSLSFDGSSGQLFSINNNLSTGWIFSISDISGLPLFRTNADGTVSMGEFGGNVGIGLTNPTFKLQVAGNAGIANTLFVSGNAHFGSTAFSDIFVGTYLPGATLTNNYAGDMVLQVQNKSNDLAARTGLLLFNDTNDYTALFMNSSNYAGTGLSNVELYASRPLVLNSYSVDISISSAPKISARDTTITITPATESTSSSTGSLIVSGGAGIAKSLNVGGYLSSKPAYATAGLAATQTLTSGANNLILFTDNTDPNAWWTGVAGSGVSHRFKPNIAGLYFVSAQVHFLQGTGSGQMYIQARKNGNTFSLSRAEVVTNANGLTLNLSGTTSLDGNTDYIDFAVFTAGTQNIHGEADRAWSQATIYKIF